MIGTDTTGTRRWAHPPTVESHEQIVDIEGQLSIRFRRSDTSGDIASHSLDQPLNYLAAENRSHSGGISVYSAAESVDSAYEVAIESKLPLRNRMCDDPQTRVQHFSQNITARAVSDASVVPRECFTEL